MLKSEFWKLIDDSRHEAGGDAEAHVDTFASALDELEPNELVSFSHWYDDFYARADTWEVWGAAYIIGGGCSDDSFMDFKGWLISRGEKVYEAAIANVESLAKVVGTDEDCQVEGFFPDAAARWARKTGKKEADFPPSPLASMRDGIGGKAWSEDDLPKRFPKLCKKFND